MVENAWEEYVNNKNNNVGSSTMYMGYKSAYDAFGDHLRSHYVVSFSMEEGGKGKGACGNKQPWGKGYRRKSRSRFYNVYFGRRTGIYASWHECNMQVLGFSGASLEFFDTYEESKEIWDKHITALGGAKPIPHDPPNVEASSSGFTTEASTSGFASQASTSGLASENSGNLEAFLVGLLLGLAMTQKQLHL
ncbi:hypothetical protein RIF29_18930 [Crotalaria pallida]|uniref:Ribonuclease H1 N-terminal domain-containing protein n=1 Tax=Crotalaria pallida TaxID=3830 RepID=A0AAN9I521_CROPI